MINYFFYNEKNVTIITKNSIIDDVISVIFFTTSVYGVKKTISRSAFNMKLLDSKEKTFIKLVKILILKLFVLFILNVI